MPQKQGNHRLMKEGLFLALPVSLFPRFSLDLRVDHSRLVLCEKSKLNKLTLFAITLF